MAGGLRYETNFPDPAPGAGDVVVQVRAAALSDNDIFTRRGRPGIKIPMPAIMGHDVAGEIRALGPGVTGWKLGVRVFGDPINRVEGARQPSRQHLDPQVCRCFALEARCDLRCHRWLRPA